VSNLLKKKGGGYWKIQRENQAASSMEDPKPGARKGESRGKGSFMESEDRKTGWLSDHTGRKEVVGKEGVLHGEGGRPQEKDGSFPEKGGGRDTKAKGVCKGGEKKRKARTSRSRKGASVPEKEFDGEDRRHV